LGTFNIQHSTSNGEVIRFWVLDVECFFCLKNFPGLYISQTQDKQVNKSATSGKAGGLTEVERLKAAEPFGRKIPPFDSKHNVHSSSKFLAQSTANPAISILLCDYPSTKPATAHGSARHTTVCPFSHTPGTVKLCESSGRAGGFPMD
jgi:hypothetical protein